MHRSLALPAGAGFLGFAAVLPEHRGLGLGRILGEAILGWAKETGYPAVVTDWRMTNLLSSRTWPRLGFRPTFFRLFRAIA
jgi:GNAT superfamily N-acetyltransferase